MQFSKARRENIRNNHLILKLLILVCKFDEQIEPRVMEIGTLSRQGVPGHQSADRVGTDR